MIRGPLPQTDYEAIFSRVPRLTVEVVITGAKVAEVEGILLTRREDGPCRGLWHIPGGTVRFGEKLTDAVKRVARQELGLAVVVGSLIGYIEYPSHLDLGDWPVGIAFHAQPVPPSTPDDASRSGTAASFRRLPEEMHEEQKAFLRAHGLAS
jgi:ADP-ribose pyrophosphatase YjhB (NUDIX family)